MVQAEQFQHPDDFIEASPHEFQQLKESPAWGDIQRHLLEVKEDIYQQILNVSTERELGELQGQGKMVAIMLGLPDFLSEIKEAQLNNAENVQD